MRRKSMVSWVSVCCACALLLAACHAAAEADAAKRIEICGDNPAYWQYGGRPVMLLGGSDEDNLFQLPEIKAQLDLLASIGGNYVRCTMSCRDDGNVWPFKRLESGKYDLDQWNEEFWDRFERFLELTSEREIIVQIEVWATFDYYRDIWARNPFNPLNNVTYTVEQTGLPTEVNSHPTRCENNFFWSVPAERNQATVLKYQHRFVEKILSYSLRHGNVLYCMDNETSVTPEWGKYWSEFIKAKAAEAGVTVHTTEMWDAWNLSNPQHGATFDHPETYSFVDISQNNHNSGQKHWDNAQGAVARLTDPVRPANTVKIYGADGGRFGDSRDAAERFWRNVFGGIAATRFHRPDSGHGLDPLAQANIKSARMLMDEMLFIRCRPPKKTSSFSFPRQAHSGVPRARNDRLSDREPNEAYCFARPGEEFAVYFPRGGTVSIDLSSVKGQASLRWLDIAQSQWSGPAPVNGGTKLVIETPSDSPCVAYIVGI